MPPRTPSNVIEMKEEQEIWRLEELGFEKKINTINVVNWFVFLTVGFLNWLWPFIFIRWGGLALQEIIL
jgi:hypothetical protein